MAKNTYSVNKSFVARVVYPCVYPGRVNNPTYRSRPINSFSAHPRFSMLTVNNSTASVRRNVAANVSRIYLEYIFIVGFPTDKTGIVMLICYVRVHGLVKNIKNKRCDYESCKTLGQNLFANGVDISVCDFSRVSNSLCSSSCRF